MLMLDVKRIIRNKTAQNAGWLVGGRIIQMAISFFVSIITARYLGPSNFGLINYGTAYTSFFMSFCTLGINSVLVKELLNNKENQGTVMGTSLVLKTVSSFLSAILIIGIVSIVDMGEKITIIVVALCSIGVVFNVLETFNYWFQSRLESKVTAIAVLIGYISTSLYKIVLLIFKKSVVWFALATSLDYVCVGVVLIYCYYKHKGTKLKFSKSYAKQILSSSWHFILPSLMVSIYGQTDKLMLKKMISNEEIGYYSTAVSLTTCWCFVLTAIIDSLYPTIMETYKSNNTEEFEKKNRLLYSVVFYISVFVSVFFTVFSKPIIFILYGEKFLPSVNPLRIITWYTAFSYLGVARNAWIVCNDYQKHLSVVYISAALSNVLLNILLIPSFGASGAAFASLMAQTITILITPLFIKDLKPNAKLMIEAILLKDLFKKKNNLKSEEDK